MPGPNGWTVTVNGGTASYPPSSITVSIDGVMTLTKPDGGVIGPWAWGQWKNLNPTNLPVIGTAATHDPEKGAEG